MNSGRRSLAVSVCALIALVTLFPSQAWSNGRTFAYQRIISNATSGASNFGHPTVVTLAPDGKLFFAQDNGRIFYATLDANFNVVGSVVEINTIYTYGGGSGRLVTGMAFDTATGDLYVSHSDVLVNNASVGINSGRITRLFASGGFATPVDVATNLPRSKSDHGPNGLAFHSGKLYLAQGSMTNAGVPTTPTAVPFFGQAEQANSAAILEFNLSLPTPITPVVYATGLRNPYDLLWHSNGELYVNDNGPNVDAPPIIYGNRTIGGGNCGDSGVNVAADDVLNHVVPGGYYGHPNPNRSPTPECNFRSGGTYTLPAFDYGLHTSSDGIAEYTSSLLPGLASQILTANWGSQDIVSVKLASLSSGVTGRTIWSGLNRPVDLTVRQSDGAIFVAEYGPPPGAQQSFISVLKVKQSPGLNYDGDNFADLMTMNPSTSMWHGRLTRTGTAVTFGPFAGGTQVPFATDVNGDGQAEFAVWDPVGTAWYVGGIGTFLMGSSGDIPLAGDLDGDGRTDLVTMTPSTSMWHFRYSATGATTNWGPFGGGSQVPFLVDPYGTGVAVPATWDPGPGAWYVAGFGNFTVGSPGDVPVVGDLDGDGRTDLGVVSPTTSMWHVRLTGSGTVVTFGPFGGGTQVPYLIDVNGDGAAEYVEWDPVAGAFYVAGIGTYPLGSPGDIPVRVVF
jgi:glucose/arabinose dehydrogenase